MGREERVTGVRVRGIVGGGGNGGGRGGGWEDVYDAGEFDGVSQVLG